MRSPYVTNTSSFVEIDKHVFKNATGSFGSSLYIDSHLCFSQRLIKKISVQCKSWVFAISKNVELLSVFLLILRLLNQEPTVYKTMC